MATLTVDVFVSVDGWAGGDGLPGYFGYFGPELGEWIRTEMDRPHVDLYGRVTYEALAGLPEAARDDGYRRMAESDKVVFSRTLKDSDWPNTRICADDPVAEVRRLKESGDTPLRSVGSLSVARHLLDAGLVDRLRLMTFPLLAAESGREPFFAGVAAADLELAGHRVLDGRVVLLEYRPTGRDIPRT